ncbi:MAG: PDZ domain-containing protein [Phycisphaerales bacterium]|nr:PDZ domain-containing protein [Phycisphaerales bacterium]
MKLFLMYLLLGLAPNVMAWNWTLNDGKDVTVEAQVVVVGEDGENDPAKVRTIKVIAKPGDEEQAADRGWLGVSIGEVPEALAAQLNLKGRGIVILNVVEGSPADGAGIEAHDILLSINGQEVSGEIGHAVEAIKSHRPGESLNVAVLHNGQQKTINVTLGSRADLKEKKLEWKFEGSPDAEVEEHIKTRGKFMMRDPDGHWITKDLGDLDQLKNLPQGIRAFIPESGSKSIQVFVENGQNKKTIKTRVENDGASTTIEQTDGNAITVRRTDASGSETVATYPNEDALKAGDEEAYQLFQEVDDSITINVDGDGVGHSVILRGRDDDDDGLFGIGHEEWRAKLEASLAQAKEAHRRVMEELHDAMEQWSSGATPDALKLDQLQEMLHGDDGPFPQSFAFQIGKAKHTFEARADGSIEVRIRKGDSELVQIFQNESDLAQRRPELYKKYEALKAADQE